MIVWSCINRRLVDGESINWGTRLTPVLSATSLLSLNLDMGYVHPNDHRYQTVVLYNRNPVSVEATIAVNMFLLPRMAAMADFSPCWRKE